MAEAGTISDARRRQPAGPSHLRYRHRMTRRIVLTILLSLALLAIGVAGFGYFLATKPEPELVEPPRVALTVEAIRLEPSTVVAPVSGYGTARASRHAVISSEVSGRVIGVAEGLDDGVAVEAGAVLVRIDPRQYEAELQRARSRLAAERAALARIAIEEESLKEQLDTARAEFAVADREVQRISDLLESGTSSERELDAARVTSQRAQRVLQELQTQLAVVPDRRAQQQANVELAEAEVVIAELNVERCRIIAPFAGRVEAVDVDPGEQVAPGQQLLALLDPRRIEVPIELPISYRDRVRVGATAHMSLESNRALDWTGEVARIAPAADAATRTFSVFVEVWNPEQAQSLMPGVFVQAEIEGPTLEDVLLVPRAAVRQSEVFVAEGGAARSRKVAVGQHLNDRTVVSGLQPGDIVITSNFDVLYDGAPVEPVLAEMPERRAARVGAESSTP